MSQKTTLLFLNQRQANIMAIQDRFGRKIDYVRVSVTDRCDLRCSYCLPKSYKDFSTPEHWLSYDEITRVVRAFTELGTSRIRLTGGEPLVRPELNTLARQLTQLPLLKDLSLSTNATRLAKQASSLQAAGIARINVSLDTLDPDTYKAITQGNLDKTLKGLEAAKAANFDFIKINCVVMKGINDHQLLDMVDYCRKNDFTLRFIETMPMGSAGLDIAKNHYLSLQTVRKQLEQKFELIPDVMPGGGPARYVRIAGSDCRIGFITPISQHFCETCNRVRLSAEGTLYMCLGQEHSMDLRTPLRAGISDKELKELILQAIELKPERHEFNEKPEQIVRFMSMTGG